MATQPNSLTIYEGNGPTFTGKPAGTGLQTHEILSGHSQGRRSDYCVTVPDLPGCFSAGSTLEEAFANAVEAAECHIEGMLIDQEELPAPGRMEDHVNNPAYAGGILWGIIDVDLSKLSGATHSGTAH